MPVPTIESPRTFLATAPHPHPLVGMYVTVKWKNIEWDWHWYYVDHVEGGLIKVTGASGPDRAPWSGSAFWAPVTDIEMLYLGIRTVSYDTGEAVIFDEQTPSVTEPEDKPTTLEEVGPGEEI